MESIFLICGDDDFQISQELEKIKSKYSKLEKGINYLVFDKDNIASLGNELSTYSFFAEPKLIVVKVPKASKKEDDEETEESIKESKSTAWFSKELQEQIINRVDNIELVFIENGKSKVALTSFFNKNGKVVNCEKKKGYDLIKFVTEYAKSKNLNINREDAKYLIEISPSDSKAISNSIDILQDYVEYGIITRKAIDDICIKTSEIIVFDLTDSLGARNKSKALKYLDDLINSKEPIQKILVILTRHFKNLLLAKECINNHLNVEKELDITGFQASKYKTQCQNFKLEELIAIFKELCKLDINSKQSQVDLKISLQRIFMM